VSSGGGAVLLLLLLVVVVKGGAADNEDTDAVPPPPPESPLACAEAHGVAFSRGAAPPLWVVLRGHGARTVAQVTPFRGGL